VIKDIEVPADGPAWSVAVAVARFNAKITDMMWEGCRATLEAGGVGSIMRVPVPGAFELPLVCRWLVESERFDAVVALGAVVRGETAHFDFISAECTRGLGQVALESRIPVAFGVLTPENAQQAIERADPAQKNKGREAAQAALDMMALGSAIRRGAA